MSTQINVAVDRGGLLARNRQQVIANRAAKQEGSDLLVVQRKATKERGDAIRAKFETGTIATSSKRPVLKAASARGNRNRYYYFGPLYPGRSIPINSPTRLRTEVFLIDTPGARGPNENVGETGFDTQREYLTVDINNPAASEENVLFFNSSGGPNGAPYLEQTMDLSSGQAGVAYEVERGPDEHIPNTNVFTAELFTRLLTSGGAPVFEIQFRGFSIVQEPGTGEEVLLRFDYSLADAIIETPISLNLSGFANWTHLAIVHDGAAFKIFQDGISVAQIAAPGLLHSPQLLMMEGAVRQYNLSGISPPSSVALALSSLRIVPRVLYTDNFTPPLSIR